MFCGFLRGFLFGGGKFCVFFYGDEGALPRSVTGFTPVFFAKFFTEMLGTFFAHVAVGFEMIPLFAGLDDFAEPVTVRRPVWEASPRLIAPVFPRGLLTPEFAMAGTLIALGIHE